MGHFDYRCAVSGVSLRGADAVLVGLEPAGERYRPVILGITGSYDRLGSIDDITEDVNTELVTAYFRERARTGDFVLATHHEGEFGNPPRDIASVLGYFERNLNDSSEERPAAALFGQRLFPALVAKPVWSAVASTYAPGGGSAEAWFKELFGDSRAAEEAYRGRIPDLASHIGELAAVDGFLRARGLTWALPESEQHYGSEMRAYLEEARAAFSDVPAVLVALERYADRVADLLVDE